MLGARTTVTPFQHQPEAQHPKSFSYPQAAGRLPHLWGALQTQVGRHAAFEKGHKRTDIASSLAGSRLFLAVWVKGLGTRRAIL
jgi:hypothetical protein